MPRPRPSHRGVPIFEGDGLVTWMPPRHGNLAMLTAVLLLQHPRIAPRLCRSRRRLHARRCTGVLTRRRDEVDYCTYPLGSGNPRVWQEQHGARSCERGEVLGPAASPLWVWE
jgi:hypothetical protein